MKLASWPRAKLNSAVFVEALRQQQKGKPHRKQFSAFCANDIANIDLYPTSPS